MKYIDADKLIAEIETRIIVHKKILKEDNSLISAAMLKGSLDAYESIERFITSLQQEQPEVDLDKLVSEEFASHSRSTEYGLEVTYNRAELYQLIKRMALVFNARKEDEKGILAEVMQLAGFKPPFLDGNQYCTLFGIDLMRSFVGFGNTETESFVEALKDVKNFIEK